MIPLNICLEDLIWNMIGHITCMKNVEDRQKPKNFQKQKSLLATNFLSSSAVRRVKKLHPELNNLVYMQ